MELSPQLDAFPNRITPYVRMNSLNERVELAKGQFNLQSESARLGTIDGVVTFRWLPSAGFEFEGDYSGAPLELERNDLSLMVSTINSSVPVHITNIHIGSGPQPVRGVFKETTTTGKDSHFDTLRCCLVNFPSYVGAPIKCEAGICSGRLEAVTPRLSLVVDEIMETSNLRDSARREGGLFISLSVS